MMDSKTIEMQAVSAVEQSIIQTTLLHPIINSNDTEPIWDGNIYIYSNKRKSKKDMIGRVATQVKGVFSKKNEKKKTVKYSVNMNDLENYFYDGGVIYFVVYIDNNYTSTIYYASLTPVKISHYLKKAKGKYTTTIEFVIFPSESYKKINLLNNILKDNKQQASFSKTGFLSLENLDLDKTNLTFEIFREGVPVTNFHEYLFETEFYLYATIEDSPIPHPIDQPFKIKSIPTTILEEIRLNGKTYYSQFEKEIFVDKTILKIGYGIVITIIGKSNKANLIYNPSEMLRYNVKDLEFLLDVLQTGYVWIGENKLIFDSTNEKFKRDINILKHNKAYFEKLIALLNSLNIIEDLNVSLLTENDHNVLKLLIDIFVDKKQIAQKKHTNGMLRQIEISNLKILLMYKEVEDKKVVLCDFLTSRVNLLLEYENGEKCLAPTYSYLKTDDFIEISNIKYDDILQSYKDLLPFEDQTYNRANETLLKLLLAYDKSNHNKNILLNIAKDISTWILYSDKKDLPLNIKLLNHYQIIKRQREFNENERDELLKMSVDSSVVMEKAAANILLDNKLLADFYLKQLPSEELEALKDYPIYYFMK